MSLAIFDLDNTLLGGDSDYLWGKFLVEKALVDPVLYEQENQRFYDEYKAGTLDIYDFLKFSLAPLSEHSVDTLSDLHREFMHNKINSIWLPKAEELLNKHRQNDDFLLIITATNHFVTAPIAKKFDGKYRILNAKKKLVEIYGVPKHVLMEELPHAKLKNNV